jgi:hypothetical protein
MLMLVKVNLDNKAFSLINELIAEGKYPDLYHFIEIAINNQIQEEFSEESVIPIPKITEDESSYFESKEILKDETESQLKVGKDKWQEKLREIHLEKSGIEPIKRDLIWSFYNRFLPVKIVIRELAILMVKYGTWIELAQLKDYAYVFAREISQILKKYEDREDVPRNLKLSTGLPTPPSELASLKGAKKRKKELKLLSSKTRFMEQFVGRKTSGKNPEFHGAGFSMGLIAVKFVNNTCFVSLTENGREFALLNNPVIDGEQKDVAFFDDEVNFIMKNIIPRYTFEKIIVERILDELKKRPLTSNEINEIFKNAKKSFLLDQNLSNKQIKDELDEGTIVQERVATMGRLSEMGLVKWTIDSGGYSSYTIKAK